MSEQDKLPRINWEQFNPGLMEEVLEAANHDMDPASCFVMGDSLEETPAMFFVVRGGANVRCVLKLLEAVGFMTPGKPVVDGGWYPDRDLVWDCRKGISRDRKCSIEEGNELFDGRCPDCGAYALQRGPEGGASVNVRCAACGSLWNIGAAANMCEFLGVEAIPPGAFQVESEEAGTAAATTEEGHA